nr:hypothetical protein [Tanacetum cinerariifolium]
GCGTEYVRTHESDIQQAQHALQAAVFAEAAMDQREHHVNARHLAPRLHFHKLRPAGARHQRQQTPGVTEFDVRRLLRSIALITLRADCNDTSCSEDCPPKTMATDFFKGEAPEFQEKTAKKNPDPGDRLSIPGVRELLRSSVLFGAGAKRGEALVEPGDSAFGGGLALLTGVHRVRRAGHVQGDVGDLTVVGMDIGFHRGSPECKQSCNTLYSNQTKQSNPSQFVTVTTFNFSTASPAANVRAFDEPARSNRNGMNDPTRSALNHLQRLVQATDGKPEPDQLMALLSPVVAALHEAADDVMPVNDRDVFMRQACEWNYIALSPREGEILHQIRCCSDDGKEEIYGAIGETLERKPMPEHR